MSRAPRHRNLTIPDGLRRWLTVTGGASWLEQLPRLVSECLEQWALDLGAPFEHAHVSFLREAGPAQRDLVVVHQDFHGGNVPRTTWT
jgi:Ser/Thr protein kinase RdoA (MazF antagonist)